MTDRDNLSAGDDGSRQNGQRDSQAPEPPENWRGPYYVNQQGGFPPNGNAGGSGRNGAGGLPPSGGKPGNEQLESGRKFVTAAKICAVVSLFVGGMLLSSVAVVLGAVAYAKFESLAKEGRIDEQTRIALRRSAFVAIGVGALALALNAVSIALLYPVLVEYMETGDLGVLLGGSGATAASSGATGSSTWG